MKLFATLIASLFAVSAFAAEPAKQPEAAKPVASAPAAKKDDKQPVKSAPAKAEDKKAETAKK